MSEPQRNTESGPGRQHRSDPGSPGAAELDHPDSPWNRAAGSREQGDPFCCRTEWQLSFHEAFAPDRPLTIRCGRGSLIAFAERLEPNLGPLLEPVESDWLFGCPLLGPQAMALLEALLREPRARRRRPSVLLSGILPRSSLCREVLAIASALGLLVHRLAPVSLCHASLHGGLDGFLSRRSASWRRNLRQAQRRGRELGVAFERHTPEDAAAAAALYERMLAVERTSWKGIGRCGMLEPPARGFYAAMLRRLAAGGNGRVMFARHRDRDIGFIFGGLAGPVYRGQQFSYAEDWSRTSIGNLLALEQIRWLCDEGIARYDMGPVMDYKRHWTEARTDLETLLLVPV